MSHRPRVYVHRIICGRWCYGSASYRRCVFSRRCYADRWHCERLPPEPPRDGNDVA
jgi:hypothetical protein